MNDDGDNVKEAVVLPPPIDADASDDNDDGDAALLEAIRSNAECARVLAAIAGGGDAAALVASLVADSGGGDNAEGADVGMYQDLSGHCDGEGDVRRSFPSFLEFEREDFFDNF